MWPDLDSSTLADLRELFSHGIQASEVLVLLLSEGLLTRPWASPRIEPSTVAKIS